METPYDPMQALARYLAGEEEVLLAYRFGSRALSSSHKRASSTPLDAREHPLTIAGLLPGRREETLLA